MISLRSINSACMCASIRSISVRSVDRSGTGADTGADAAEDPADAGFDAGFLGISFIGGSPNPRAGALQNKFWRRILWRGAIARRY
ncbi:hypothetical protein [Ancylobacter radicis]|uniref:hypothetical protein n=1 Tax=Ancylobacter radicis TaxID=2836179 RepID=UPI002022B8A3|nr:hypothetical protein [Ancylobacter radicis]